MSEADAWNKADRELKDENRNQMMWKYGSLIQYYATSMLLIFEVFFYCPIMCLYVLTSEFWCPLRHRHTNDVRFVFTSSCLQKGSCFIYALFVWWRIVMSNTYCVVLLVCVSSSCVPYVASFSGLSLFDCRYSLTFIYYLQLRCGQLELQAAIVAADMVYNRATICYRLVLETYQYDDDDEES